MWRPLPGVTGAPREGDCARRPWRLPGRAAVIGGRDAAMVAADLGPIEINLRHIRRCEKGAARGGGAPLSALEPLDGPSVIWPAAGSGGAAAGENRAGFGYGGRWRRLRRRFLTKASSLQSASPISVCSRGNPRSGSLGSNDDDPFRVVLPPGGIVLEQLLVGTGKERWRVEASNMSSTASLGGTTQRSLGVGRVMMVTRRSDMLSSVVTTCLTRLIHGSCREDDGF